jgi:hypothetical protein
MKKWILRLSMLFAVCIVWSGLVGFKNVNQKLAPDPKQSALSAIQLIGLVNDIRTQHGYSSLIVDKILMSTAQATADEMAARSMIGPFGDLQEIALAAGYGNGRIGEVRENIACLPPGAGYEAILDAWADPDNQVMMADPAYQHIGAGVAISVDGQVIYVIHAAYTKNQNYDPDQPVPGRTPVVELIEHAISKAQAGDASGNLSQVDFGPTPTNSPIIPGTGRRIDDSVITMLTVVAVLGISLVGLALILKK